MQLIIEFWFMIREIYENDILYFYLKYSESSHYYQENHAIMLRSKLVGNKLKAN